MNNVSKVILTVLFLIASFGAIGCKTDNVMSPDQNAGNLQIGIKSAEVAVNPELTLNSAMFLFSDIIIENSEGSRKSNLIYGPIVGKVNISSTGQVSNEVSNIAITNIPPGLYNQVDFSVLNDQEYETRTVSGMFFGQPYTNEKFTTIITGRYNNEPFMYRTNIVINKEIKFNSALNVSTPDDLQKIALIVAPEMWFKENGVTLNPNNPEHKQAIDLNILESFTGVLIQ